MQVMCVIRELSGFDPKLTSLRLIPLTQIDPSSILLNLNTLILYLIHGSNKKLLALPLSES